MVEPIGDDEGRTASPVDAARQRHLANICAILAHEINNLMTPIVTRADFALSSGDGALIKKSLEKCLVQAQKVVALTRRLSDYAEDGRAATAGSSASLKECVDAACELLVRPPGKDGIEFSLAIAADIQVAFDADELTATVLNLLLIAIERAQPARSPIHVAAVRSGSRVNLRIEDRASAAPMSASALDVRMRAAQLLCGKNAASVRIEPASSVGQSVLLDLPSA